MGGYISQLEKASDACRKLNDVGIGPSVWVNSSPTARRFERDLVRAANFATHSQKKAVSSAWAYWGRDSQNANQIPDPKLSSSSKNSSHLSAVILVAKFPNKWRFMVLTKRLYRLLS